MDQLELKLREHLDDSLQSIESRVSQDFQAGYVLVSQKNIKHMDYIVVSVYIYIYIHYIHIYICVCLYAALSTHMDG